MRPDQKEAFKMWIAAVPVVLIALLTLAAVPFLFVKIFTETEHPWQVAGIIVFAAWMVIGGAYIWQKNQN